ncbi:MAG: AEC family transporter [Lachnospiraceae bacterium]
MRTVDDMTDFSGLFEMQGMLFCLMILGLILARIGLVKRDSRGFLTDLVIQVTLPASILKSFQMQFDGQILRNCMVVIVVAIAIQIGTYLLGMVLYNWFPDGRKRVLQYATICSNAGILGNPIAEGVFGLEGLLYASVYVIPQRIFMWSVGLTYFTEAPDRKKLIKKIMTHPCIVSVVIGFGLMISQLQLPGFLNLTIEKVADANTGLAMILVGTILAEIPVRQLVDRQVAYYTMVRLFLVPLLVFLGCYVFRVDGFVAGVSVVLSGMPAASVTAVMAAKYGKDEVFATKCVVLSTLLSMVTVPLWCLFLG